MAIQKHSGIRQMGKYRLMKRLAGGGYGDVWKARDTVEGILVALKLPLADPEDAGKQALLKEVKLVSQLRHPNILPVKNAEFIEDRLVLATELCAGTLADQSKPMAARRAVTICREVLKGLEYAHQNRVIHCDVSPGNIFLFPDGRVALGDFGISRSFERSMPTMLEFGTPGYVAPEQAYGKPTYASDCFSVGLILYETITGYLPRWPFEWPPNRINRLRDRGSASLQRVIRQAIRIDAARRYTDAGKMLAAMNRAVPEDADRSDFQKKAGAPDWQRVRREAFLGRYQRVLRCYYRCGACGEPISEPMQMCPWCGEKMAVTPLPTQDALFCPDCHRGILPEWRFCPWCYGRGFASPANRRRPDHRYKAQCRHCRGKLMRFMRYCPWCRRKVKRPWHVRPFPEICARCGWSVDTSFWTFCCWCARCLWR